MKYLKYLFPALLIAFVVFAPDLGFCSVGTTLDNVQNAMLSKIFPALATLGLIIAGISFVMGSPNGRSHLVLAICGMVIAFAAPSIMEFIKGLAR